jgi:hypothetical protein
MSSAKHAMRSACTQAKTVVHSPMIRSKPIGGTRVCGYCGWRALCQQRCAVP